MARKLVNIFVVFALLTGCWGGVIAAAACPHVECETMVAAPESTAAHDQHGDNSSHDSTTHKDHSGHGEESSAEPSAPDHPQVDSDQFRGVASSWHDPNCAHCVGSTDGPPSRSFEWQTNSFKNGGKLTAPRAAEQISMPAAVWVREITPAQHAPPGRSDRHLLLLNVFRI